MITDNVYNFLMGLSMFVFAYGAFTIKHIFESVINKDEVAWK